MIFGRYFFVHKVKLLNKNNNPCKAKGRESCSTVIWNQPTIIYRPPLEYGCMRFPDKNRKIDSKRAEAQLRYAIDQGVNYLDTAFMYHFGESEPFLGRVLS